MVNAARESCAKGDSSSCFLVDQTVLRYVEPAKQTWDGTTTNDTLVVTNFAGTTSERKDGMDTHEWRLL